MPWGKGICGGAPPPKGAKRASAQRRSLFCSAGTPSPTPGWHRPAEPPLFRRHRAFANAAEKGSCCPKRFPLAPAGGTTYCFGGRGLNSVLAPAVLCRDTIPRTGAVPTRGAPLFRWHRAFVIAAERGSWRPQTVPSPPGRRDGLLLRRARPQLGSRTSCSLQGRHPSHWGSADSWAPPLLGGTGPSSSPQRGAIGGPKRFPFPPAGGTTYCFGGRGLNSAPAPTGRGRVTPLFPNRRSRRSPGRKTGYHTAPDGRWRGTKGGIPLHQGVDLLQCTTSPSNLPDRQQRVQHFFLLLTGRAIDWSPPSRKDLIASWQSVGLSLRHGALALPPAACHEASTRYLVRCDNT